MAQIASGNDNSLHKMPKTAEYKPQKLFSPRAAGNNVRLQTVLPAEITRTETMKTENCKTDLCRNELPNF